MRNKSSLRHTHTNIIRKILTTTECLSIETLVCRGLQITCYYGHHLPTCIEDFKNKRKDFQSDQIIYQYFQRQLHSSFCFSSNWWKNVHQTMKKKFFRHRANYKLPKCRILHASTCLNSEEVDIHRILEERWGKNPY